METTSYIMIFVILPFFSVIARGHDIVQSLTRIHNGGSVTYCITIACTCFGPIAASGLLVFVFGTRNSKFLYNSTFYIFGTNFAGIFCVSVHMVVLDLISRICHCIWYSGCTIRNIVWRDVCIPGFVLCFDVGQILPQSRTSMADSNTNTTHNNTALKICVADVIIDYESSLVELQVFFISNVLMNRQYSRLRFVDYIIFDVVRHNACVFCVT